MNAGFEFFTVALRRDMSDCHFRGSVTQIEVVVIVKVAVATSINKY